MGGGGDKITTKIEKTGDVTGDLSESRGTPARTLDVRKTPSVLLQQPPPILYRSAHPLEGAIEGHRKHKRSATEQQQQKASQTQRERYQR